MTRLHRATFSALLVLAAASAQSAVAAPSVSPISTFPHRGQLAFHGTTTVVTQIDGESATLFVGKGGTIPLPAKGAQSLPAWGQPHLGTDAARKPVVVYPHCDSTAISSCNLRVYDVLTGKDAVLAGVNEPSAGETEGVMDRGAVAFTRWTASQQPVPLAQGGHDDHQTTLLYRAAGKAARVITKQGGQQLALDRGRILQVRNVDRTHGVCGRPALELLHVAGTKKPVRLAQYGCGLNGQTILAPTFTDGWIMWGLRTTDGDSIARVQGSKVGSTPAYASVPGGYAIAVPSARSGARLLTGDQELDPTTPDPGVGLANVIGLSFTAKRP